MEEQRSLNNEQDVALAQASRKIKDHAFFMRKAIKEDNMKDALAHAASLLYELRTSLLGPQKYYELYMQANDELQSLEAFFAEEHSKGRSFSSLYELVQHAGNVVPRLYLLCSVGSCAIRSQEAPAKEILRDMAEMCKGVQHPTRGLFLRAYLVQVCRGLLPDTGSQYEGPDGGNVVDAIEFLLSNFTEMNKLWVRMKHQPHAAGGGLGGSGNGSAVLPRFSGVGGSGTTSAAEAGRTRERERMQLADLIGKNLTQLSQLEGLTFELYRDVVLPRVLEQVVACKDELAQGYLMQCISAAFPDEYHVGTLEALLGALPSLQPGVKLATVMGSLLELLASHASRDPSVIASLDAADAFTKMKSAAAASVKEHQDMPASDVAALHSGLLVFASTVYPDRLDYVDGVLQACYEALASRGGGAQLLSTDSKAQRHIIDLLTTPLERYPTMTALGFKHYAPIVDILPPARRREMARKVAESVSSSTSTTPATAATNGPQTAEETEVLLTFAAPLLGTIEGLDLDEDEEAEDAALLARLLLSLRNADDAHAQHEMLQIAMRQVAAGGPVRVRAAVPVLCFTALQAARKDTALISSTTSSSSRDGNGNDNHHRRWYQSIHHAASHLADADAAHSSGLALQLLLSAGLSASQDACDEEMAFSLIQTAFLVFEDNMFNSREEGRVLHSIFGTLHRCRVFGDTTRGILVHKATTYCSKLLKRSDQCMAVLASTHLYWQNNLDGESEDVEGEGGVSKAEEEEGEEEADKPATDTISTNKWLRPAVRDAAAVVSCLQRALRVLLAVKQQRAVVASPIAANTQQSKTKTTRGDGPTTAGYLFVEISNAYLDWLQRGVDGVDMNSVQSVLDEAAKEVESEVCLKDDELQGYWRRTKERVKGDDLFVGLKV